MKDDEIWNFISEASKILFPTDVKQNWKLVAEYISYGEPGNQYRLYIDGYGNKRYAKINLETGMNV